MAGKSLSATLLGTCQLRCETTEVIQDPSCGIFLSFFVLPSQFLKGLGKTVKIGHNVKSTKAHGLLAPLRCVSPVVNYILEGSLSFTLH